MVACSTF